VKNKLKFWADISVYYTDTLGEAAIHKFTRSSSSLEEVTAHCQLTVTRYYQLANLIIQKFVITSDGVETVVEVGGSK